MITRHHSDFFEFTNSLGAKVYVENTHIENSPSIHHDHRRHHQFVLTFVFHSNGVL